MRLLKKDKDYAAFLYELKSRIKSVQIKAAVSVNRDLMELYWELAKKIVEKQKTSQWGDGLLTQMSKDLQEEFPDMKGFSLRNLKYMRQWFLFWTEEEPIGQQLVAQSEFAKQLVTQIPWGHNLLIASKSKNHEEALFYAKKTIENNWSRAVLTHQIEGNLFGREGKARTNSQIKERHFNLDISWLKNGDLEDTDTLPEPQLLVAEAIIQLGACVDEPQLIMDEIEAEELE
jgi:predicted nuclease of restriction endonuclease-like (RecB) superfamily